eukprot:694970-Prorocentrum_minimum.AAC.1
MGERGAALSSCLGSRPLFLEALLSEEASSSSRLSLLLNVPSLLNIRLNTSSTSRVTSSWTTSSVTSAAALSVASSVGGDATTSGAPSTREPWPSTGVPWRSASSASARAFACALMISKSESDRNIAASSVDSPAGAGNSPTGTVDSPTGAGVSFGCT